MADYEDPRGEFRSRTLKVSRDGMDGLWEWLDGSDFFQAPASTRFHGSHAGGLAEHSLAVHDELLRLNGAYDANMDEDSMAICALLHDVCKVGCYKADTRNVKDERGVWHKVPCYRFQEDYAFGGHGAKSVYLVQSFVRLEPDEAAAINCHMGQFDATQYSKPSEVYARSMLAWLLHVADEAASFVDGK